MFSLHSVAKIFLIKRPRTCHLLCKSLFTLQRQQNNFESDKRQGFSKLQDHQCNQQTVKYCKLAVETSQEPKEPHWKLWGSHISAWVLFAHLSTKIDSLFCTQFIHSASV